MAGTGKNTKKKETITRTVSASDSSKAALKRKKRLEKQREKIEERLEFERAHRIADEIGSIVLIAVSVFLVFALQTTKVGVFGSFFAGFLKGLFGRVAYILPYFLGVYALLQLFKLVKPIAKRSLLFFFIAYFLIDIFDGVRWVHDVEFAFNLALLKEWYTEGMVLRSAGAFGTGLAMLFVKIIGTAGTYIFASAGILVLLLLTIRVPISEMAQITKDKADAVIREHEENRALKKEQEAEYLREKEKEQELCSDGQLEMNPALYDPKTIEKNARKEEQKKKNILSLMRDGGLFSHRDSGEEQAVLPSTEENNMDSVSSEADSSETDFASANADRTEEPKRRYGLEEPYFIPKGMGLVSSEPEDEARTDYPEEPADFHENSGAESRFSAYTGTSGNRSYSGNNTADLDPSALWADKKKIPETRFTSAGEGEDVPDAMRAFAGRKENGQASRESVSNGGENPMELPVKPYQFPPISLLQLPKKQVSGKDRNTLAESSRKLEDALKTFGVQATVTNVIKGPTVTRYELQPQPGVKVSQIQNLADDMALTLAAKYIRIEAPIPGKSAVGIEIENEAINTVYFREVLESREFQSAKSRVSAGIGKDIGGQSIICNLKEMPHLLIAGATGAGKSVCVNTIIMSLLFKAKPDEVKLILIDPKKVELSNYNGIPHLLTPVVTDTSKAAGALNWCVSEMMRRYQLFADEGVRDMKSYNELMAANGEPEKGLPFIVIIIDELADLMMAAGKQVEPAICRIGQLARAAGMHMVIATQSPRVDVITGLIKANIPSRIALMCSQRIDSQVILDEPGAEKLVGKGDMLFLGPGASKPYRVQGAFVSDDEINKTVEYIKKHNTAAAMTEELRMTIQDVSQGDEEGKDDDGVDPNLLQEAIQAVVHQQACSVSMLQRKFRIGYNHAARLVDAMELRGIVGPQDGTKPRKVLKTEAEYNSMGKDEEN